MPTAFITGITGQDGSYLTELLLKKGYVVHGSLRRSSNIERRRLDHLTVDPDIYNNRLFLHYADLSDITSLRRIIKAANPDEFYHLAGQSHVGLSFEIPESTCDFTAMGTLRILEILRDLDCPPRFLNIGSSELFGQPSECPQNEGTRFNPASPYGVAKAFSVEITRVYRNSFKMFACNAIAYNHESSRRSETFVTRKITKAIAAIACGSKTKLALGNLDVARDWGYAPEYVEAMWRILQADMPDDFILATGQLTTLKDFLACAFSHVDLNWQDYVEIDPRFVRPSEPQRLVGDPGKAELMLGWKAQTSVRDLAKLMVSADISNKIKTSS